MEHNKRIFDTFRFLNINILIRDKNFFVLFCQGKLPLAILKRTALFTFLDGFDQVHSLPKEKPVDFVLLNGSGLEHSGANWISLSHGSSFARALRSWDGIDGNGVETFGVTGAEWERAAARTATVWTQEIGSFVAMAEFEVKAHNSARNWLRCCVAISSDRGDGNRLYPCEVAAYFTSA